MFLRVNFLLDRLPEHGKHQPLHAVRNDLGLQSAAKQTEQSVLLDHVTHRLHVRNSLRVRLFFFFRSCRCTSLPPPFPKRRNGSMVEIYDIPISSAGGGQTRRREAMIMVSSGFATASNPFFTCRDAQGDDSGHCFLSKHQPFFFPLPFSFFNFHNLLFLPMFRPPAFGGVCVR